MSKSKNELQTHEEFSDQRYTVLVLQCLKRAARRPGSWIAELVVPRFIDEDVADSKDIVEAIERAIDAVRSHRENNGE